MSFLNEEGLARVWNRIVARLNEKADKEHNHDDVYETKTDAQSKLDTVNTTIEDMGSTFDQVIAGMYGDDTLFDEATATFTTVRQIAHDEITKAVATPDLSENDPTQPNYVKNRTHWVEQATEVIKEPTTDTEWHYGLNFSGYPIDTVYNENATYIVKVDGVSYQCSPWTLNDEFYIGDSRLSAMADENGEDANPEDVPFLIYVYHDDHGDPFVFGMDEIWSVTYSDLNTHTIEVVELTGGTTYHTLDENFIPETIARVSDVTPITLAEIDEICAAGVTTASLSNEVMF